eukprot:scaffold72682_cov30-Tisochrysis_lutea.AAC.5
MLYLSKHDPGKHKKAMLTLAAIKETGGPDGGYDSEESDGNGYVARLLARMLKTPSGSVDCSPRPALPRRSGTALICSVSM